MSNPHARAKHDRELDRLVRIITDVNLKNLDDALYYCDKSWPRCKPSLDMMIHIRDKMAMAAIEVSTCL